MREDGGYASVSIDVDPLPCYYKIHSLGTPPAELRARILCRSLPRFAQIFSDRDIRATFFIVAEDIDEARLGAAAREMRAAVSEVASAGHEIACHSYAHRYEMARLSRHEVQDDIGRAHELLSELAGAPLRGFRAPGYDLSASMLEALVEHGFHYDSSIFPAPGYYAAKAAVMAALRASGRPSGAVMTNPRALMAPIDPYRPHLAMPWRPGDAPLWELPIAVTRKSRSPVIGTNLLLAPALLRRYWLRSMASRPFFNFELHGIDLCDAELDGLPAALIARQPDLRMALAEKQRRFESILDALRLAGRRFARLDEYAATL